MEEQQTNGQMAAVQIVQDAPQPHVFMVPVDFVEGRPRDEKLYAAACRYYEDQFGRKNDFRGYAKAWVALDGETVVGLAGIQVAMDCSLFHCPPRNMTKEAIREAEQVRDMMIWRLHANLEDGGFRGMEVLIYVAEQAERFWRRFLKKIGARPANRYTLTI